jgi:hypothetical protein
MRVTEQARSRVTEDFVRGVLVTIAPFTDREVATLALVTFAADDREGNDNPISDPKRAIFIADFHHLAHEFVTHDVAGLHAWHESIEQVQVRAANGTGRYLYDRISGMFDDRVWDRLPPDVLLALPDKRSDC